LAFSFIGITKQMENAMYDDPVQFVMKGGFEPNSIVANAVHTNKDVTLNRFALGMVKRYDISIRLMLEIFQVD
jgi:hypothetical protein